MAPTSHGTSRMHNGNAYYYYASDMRIASLAQESIPINAVPTGTANENGAKLWRAARSGQLPRVRRLLKLGADLSYRCNEYGTTALHQAVGNSHRDVVEALLEADASVDDEDHEGKTALHFATSADVVEALIMAGADVDHENREGMTPGRLALDRQNIDSEDEDENEEEEDENADTGLQQDRVRGALGSLANYEQDTDGGIPILAAQLSDMELRLTAGNSDHSGCTTPGYHTKGHTPPQQYAIFQGRDQVHESYLISEMPTTMTPEVSSPLSAADGLPSMEIGGSDQDCRLVIGIDFGRKRDASIFYALGNDKPSPNQHITGKYVDPAWASAQSDLPSYFMLHLEFDHSLTQTEGLRDMTRLPKKILSNFIEILETQITTEAALFGCRNPPSEIRRDIVLVIPTDWPESLRAVTSQAAKTAKVREVVTITGREASLLYTLSSKNVNLINDGKTFIVCNLRLQRLDCTKQEVISTKPFRLKEFGQASGKWLQIPVPGGWWKSSRLDHTQPPVHKP
ncbi:hypothetical protein MBLNU13_g06268t2 [Cladosporium sp. NU13]